MAVVEVVPIDAVAEAAARDQLQGLVAMVVDQLQGLVAILVERGGLQGSVDHQRG